MENTYQMEIEKNKFVLKTTTFTAAKGSVLHSGIYNREFASSLAAGAVMIMIGFFFAAKYKLDAINFILSLVAFITFFLFFRIFIFRQHILESVIDRESGNITIYSKNITKKIKSVYSLSEFAGVKQNTVTIRPENPDGIKLVEKIALQHGTAIPGFGNIMDFYTIELSFKTGKNEMIYSSEDKSKTDGILKRLKEFLDR